MSTIAAGSARPRIFVIWGAFAAMCLVWGSTWLVIKEGLRDLPPLFSAASRFTVAALCMALVARLLSGRESGGRPPLWLSMTLGGLNFGPSYAIVYISETKLDSSITAVLWAVFPLLVAVAAHFALPNERLRRSQAAGFLLGFLGVLSLFVNDLAGIGLEAVAAGAFLLLSPLISALGTVIVKRNNHGVSSLLLNRDAFSFAALLLITATIAFEDPLNVSLSTRGVLSIVYLALFGTVLTFGLYWWLMRYLPAARMSLIAYMIPLVALFLGWVVGQERILPSTLAGTAMILLGVFLAARGREPMRPRGAAREAAVAPAEGRCR